ncbi:hypothetical protein B296_00004071 [Ensete ventricosum]|uniref:Peptidase A2 domain-containing protein n=1 Tax=Ensete ventricosum TaxID=4639 RepID=A0A427B7Z7_ENSVE|nr:hypothetical protein B296_00004071 [Ensete ventricosum]
MPTPNASVCSLSDLDTLSSDSTDSLREQLRLVNQRIDDVRKTLRTKDERGESPLCGSPFIQEIQDAHIPPHFCLSMLKAYEGSSDPMEHIAMKPRELSLHPKGLVERQVDVIVGGPAMGGVSSSVRKAYALAEVLKRSRTRGNPRITFKSENEYPDHDDALVVMTRIANAHVGRIMIDTGSSADILYLDAFQKLRMTKRDLIPMTSTLTRFTGDVKTLVGVAILPMTFSNEPRTKTFIVPFMMVDLP